MGIRWKMKANARKTAKKMKWEGERGQCMQGGRGEGQIAVLIGGDASCLRVMITRPHT